MPKATEVFGTLAEDYARYRPGYPSEVLDVLTDGCGMTRDWVIADIGSGTGNLARLFVSAGYRVAGVEPNREMREAAQRILADYPAFRSLDGAAESIPLESHSIDMVTIGQALHWFDVRRAGAECRRVLRPDGWIAVLWNDRPSHVTAFTREYEALTSTFAAAQTPLCTTSFSDGLSSLFGDAVLRSASFSHTQEFDLEGLLGRARSSGFIAQPGEPGHSEQTALMTDLFARHQCEGAVELHYVTQLHYGCVTD